MKIIYYPPAVVCEIAQYISENTRCKASDYVDAPAPMAVDSDLAEVFILFIFLKV